MKRLLNKYTEKLNNYKHFNALSLYHAKASRFRKITGQEKFSCVRRGEGTKLQIQQII